MNRSVRYHPLFECDIREAALWYDSRSLGLGDAFVEAARISTENAINFPERFATSSSGCRYVRLERFPYVVLFDLIGEEILMLGVLHTARSREKWKQRRNG